MTSLISRRELIDKLEEFATFNEAGMGGFGVALGLPFALFAMFPNMLKALPKSGGWLNTTKVILGFLELALAFKFLSNADLVKHWGVLKIEVFLGIWILVFAGLALYIFGKIKFPHDSPLKKVSFFRQKSALVFFFVVILRSCLSKIHLLGFGWLACCVYVKHSQGLGEGELDADCVNSVIVLSADG